MVGTEGTGKEAKFTFQGVPKPEIVPDAPPVELAKATGAGVEAPERGQASGS
jgi:ATP-dependent Clp protease ATP-binding subunit ClpC